MRSPSQLTEKADVKISKFKLWMAPNKPLLSAETGEQLELLKVVIDPEVSMHVLESSKTEQRTYSDRLKRCIWGSWAYLRRHNHYHWDPNVKPVQHSQRRVPVALTDKVKAKLDDLERKGIKEKVLCQLNGLAAWWWSQHPTRSEIVLILRISTRQLSVQRIKCQLWMSCCPSSAKPKCAAHLMQKMVFSARSTMGRKIW